MDSKSYFFCYDERLAKHLKLNRGINFITHALHKDTRNEFWLFPKNDIVRKEVWDWREKMGMNK